LWLGLALFVASCATPTDAPFQRRVFETTLDGKWLGNSIAYGPHRDGRTPGATEPNREELREVDEAIRLTNAYPAVVVVLGETGWATQKHDEGEQARLIKDQPDEEGQAVFYREWTRWSEEARLVTFFFEAFDEKWKGGPHPNEVEKHWGLYRSDRTPKKAMENDG
jgi:hypothetical protein